jgi:chemosensory pili system protein ChpA (sensor histidine kinase/response regulator)
MSALREAMSHAVLGWVKPELDETLRQARNEIEAFVEDPADTSRMRFCAGYLHQVQGTLRMVELYAPAMVAEEMELLAQAVQQGAASDRDEACATLMRGTVLLPDYLERLQNGHRDIPIVLLPLLNDIRAARGAAGLNESVLFAPDLSRPLPGQVPEASPLPWTQRQDAVAGAQAQFEQALAGWPEHGAPADAAALAAAAATLLENARHDTTRRMLWVLSSAADALRDGALAASGALRGAFAGIARSVRQAHDDESFPVAAQGVASQEPTRQLLYLVSQAQAAHPALDALREAFELDAHAPSEAELDHARGSLSGRNRDLLNTVGGVVKEELLRVKDALDLHLRTGGDAAALQPQAAELGNVADTLGMLGLGVARDVVLQQREVLDAIARGDKPASESALLDIAGALLYVDASLDDQVARLGAGEEGGEDAAAAEARRTVEVLAHEAIANFATAREHFVAFIETNWNHSRLEDVPRLLSEVSGALRILDLPQPADYLEGVRRYIGAELLKRRRVPSGRQLDTLADAMASLEYYLEALRDRRPNRDEILEIARSSLESLNYWPLPAEPEERDEEAAEAAVVAPVAIAATAASISAAQASPWDPVAAEQDAEAPVADQASVVAPEAEALDLPSLDIELPAIAPVASEAPAAAELAAQWVGFDPVAAEDATTAAAAAPVEAGAVAALQVAPAGEAGQWLDLSMKVQPELRPAQVFESTISRIELDADSHTLVAEISAAAASLGAPAGMPSAPAAAVVAGAAAAAVAIGGFDENADIDADIREVFLEEFDEERDNLARLVPLWRQAPEDMDRVRPIRRVFHTLKGSGRLVGARALGEFSWKIEGMLNRVLDGSRPPGPAVLAMVEQACAVLPQFDAALRGQAGISADLYAMEAVADRIAAGEDVFYTPLAAPAAAAEAVQDAAVEAVATAAVETFEEGTPASVDSVLREILEAEVNQHLETVDGWVASARLAPAPANDVLLRAIHTMNGAFAMTDVPEITAVTDPAETFIKRLLAASQVPESEGVEALAATADAIRTCVRALQAESPRIPRFTALAQRLHALADSLPEARWPQPVEAEAETVELVGAGHELTGIGDMSPYLDEAGAEEQSAHAGTGHETVDAVVVAGAVAAGVFIAGGADAAPSGPADAVGEAVAMEADAVAVEDYVAIASDGIEPEEVADTAMPSPGEAVETGALSVERIEAGSHDAEAGEAPLETFEIEAVEIEEVDVEDVEAGVVEAEVEAVEAGAAEAEVETVEAGAAEAEVEAVEAGAAEAEAEENVESAEAAEAAAAQEAVELPALGEPLPEFSTEEEAVADGPMLDFTELDRDLVDIFVEEGGDLLDHIDGLIQELRADPTTREAIIGLQRDLHTLKGGARMAGIATIGDLGHVIESLLEAVAEQRTELQRGDIQLLERGFDTLHRLLQQTRAHRTTEMPQVLIEEFEARLRGEKPAPAIVEEAADAVAEVASAEAAGSSTLEAAADAMEPAATGATVVPFPVPAPGPVRELGTLSAPVEDEPAAAAAGDEPITRAPQEQVRVRADLLDNLVNHAGEVAIYRSRLEQQLGAFRSAMAELDRTNARLRDQLRRLDLETEAQIVARYQREQDSADPTFDPLELDRFSTLQQLSRALNESSADLVGLQGVLDDLARQYDVLLQQQSRVSSELQDGLMSARMVPFDSIVPRLRRVVRQAAHDTKKQVQLKLDGTHGELDRNVLDRMVAPLEHMLRNSVAHGLESPKDRRGAGKDEEGTITIALRREGSEIVLQVADDGRGLDRVAIRRRAEQRGLVKPDAVLTDAELDSVIFESGFSTSEKVSQLAGRGVGMDVVRNEVRQLGGTVESTSTAGEGATFTLRLPQTLAVTQAVFVQIGDTTYAVPVASVSGIGRISRERFDAGGGVYRYAGEEYALHDMGLLVGQGQARAEGQAQVPLLLVRAGDLRAAVAIDQVVGNREIVVKPVGLQIASVPGIYGATITGDGRVVVILDVAPLVRRHLAQPERAASVEVEPSRHVPLVMVVDDSLTMRKVTGRVLERHNFEVVVARDGIEALERLEERVPDLMLLDIEMPRMDGYELATAMRADDRFRGVPIVMITSRTGEKHRQRAFEIGVQRYLGKPYQELDLMRNVYDLLGIARARG